MDTKSLQKYADIVIEVGVNLYPGQCVNIVTGVANYDFALIIAESAYNKGAKLVNIDISSKELIRKRINNSNEKYLNYIPNYAVMRSYERLSEDWANIRIDDTEELDTLKEVDSSKLSTIIKQSRTALERYMIEMMNHNRSWCVICAPGPKWAAKVFNTEPNEKTTINLWEKLKPILRLDRDDPIKAWKEHGKKLAELGKKLDGMKIDKLIFDSPGTDLEIGLTKYTKWKGGPAIRPDGRSFMPNLPTEELFTTPDFRRTTGKVKVTRPVKVMENIVEGAWFEFNNGKVVNFGAETNKDILEKYLKIDDGASYLGEIALVDSASPIFESGLLFNSILYDENASCHLALGTAYPSCLTNGHTLISNEDKKKAGCNVSLVHTDFMISSKETDVYAVDINNSKIQIMKKGKCII